MCSKVDRRSLVCPLPSVSLVPPWVSHHLHSSPPYPLLLPQTSPPSPSCLCTAAGARRAPAAQASPTACSHGMNCHSCWTCTSSSPAPCALPPCKGSPRRPRRLRGCPATPPSTAPSPRCVGACAGSEQGEGSAHWGKGGRVDTAVPCSALPPKPTPPCPALPLNLHLYPHRWPLTAPWIGCARSWPPATI